MQPEARRCLNDILTAAGMLYEFTNGITYSGYIADPLLRSATERQFGIVGEALTRLTKIDEATASRITEYQRIISFRNILIHQYDSVDDLVMWDVLQFKLPTLSLEIEGLLVEEL